MLTTSAPPASGDVWRRHREEVAAPACPYLGLHEDRVRVRHVDICSRTQELHHLKPDPHCLNRGLNVLGAAPSLSVVIGDAPSDFQATQRAGVPFLGYAHNEHKEKLLRKARADVIVRSLEPVLRELRGQA